MTTKIVDLVKKRSLAFDAFQALAAKESLTEDEQKDYPVKKRAVEEIDGQITRAREIQTLMAAGAQPSDPSGTGDPHIQIVDDDPYTNEAAAIRRGLTTTNGLRAIAAAKMFIQAGSSLQGARELAVATFRGTSLDRSRLRDATRSHQPRSRDLGRRIGRFHCAPRLHERDHRAAAPEGGRTELEPARHSDAPRHDDHAGADWGRNRRLRLKRSRRSQALSRRSVRSSRASKKLTALGPGHERPDAIRRSGGRCLCSATISSRSWRLREDLKRSSWATALRLPRWGTRHLPIATQSPWGGTSCRRLAHDGRLDGGSGRQLHHVEWRPTR